MVNILIVDDHLLMRRVIREVIEQENDFTVVAEAGDGFEAEEQAAQTQPDVVLMDLEMPGCNGFEATERVLACSPHSRIVIFTASHEERHVFQAIQHGAIGYLTKDTDSEALLHALHCAARNDLCIPGPLAIPVLAQIRAVWRTHGYFVTRRNASNAAPKAPQRTASRAARANPFAPSGSVASTGSAGIAVSAGRGVAEQPAHKHGEISTEGTLRETAIVKQPAISETRHLTGREYEIMDLIRQGLKNREIAVELEIAESTVHKHVQNIFGKLKARNRTQAIYLSGTEESLLLQ